MSPDSDTMLKSLTSRMRMEDSGKGPLRVSEYSDRVLQ
jgi:hypothetical protein